MVQVYVLSPSKSRPGGALTAQPNRPSCGVEASGLARIIHEG
jgi:hypothetical protein